jgi:hypothetical protein
VPCEAPWEAEKIVAERPRAKEGGRREEEMRPGISARESERLRNGKRCVDVPPTAGSTANRAPSSLVGSKWAVGMVGGGLELVSL